MRAFTFVIVGGPHHGSHENPVCYARTTQRGKYVRWTKPRISPATGELLPVRLTQWGRYQDYVDHVRRALGPDERATLFDEAWPLLAGGEKVIVDVVVQFRGRAHSDADHVASTIADALFPKRPLKPGRSTAYRPVWSFDTLRRSTGDKLVLPRLLDWRDGCDRAFVAAKVHGPYPRDEWLEGDPVTGFPRIVVRELTARGPR